MEVNIQRKLFQVVSLRDQTHAVCDVDFIFRAQNNGISYVQSSNLDGLCLEKRVFYRVVSGLHTSINIHLCSNYLLTGIYATTGDNTIIQFL